MNGSQIKAGIGTVLAAIFAICAGIQPFLPLLPAEYKIYGTLTLILMAILTQLIPLFNQSWSPNHVSVPVEKVAALPVQEKAKLGVLEVKK